jgi:hypothetical protein
MTAAPGTVDAIRATARNEVVPAVRGIGEVDDGFLEGLRFGSGGFHV